MAFFLLFPMQLRLGIKAIKKKNKGNGKGRNSKKIKGRLQANTAKEGSNSKNYQRNCK